MSPWLTLIIIVFLFYTGLRILGHLFQWLRPPRHSPAMAPTRWSRIPKFYRHVIINLIVGLGIFYLLKPFHHSPWLMNLEDAGMDWVMQIRQGVIPPTSEKGVPAFVLLDIDDETYQEWGEPLFTPRDRLKNLLATAIKAEPRLIVIDIDVSQKMPLATLESSTSTSNSSLHPDDQALRDYLEKYVTDCAQAAGDITCPPIILARALRHTPGSLPIIRPSFLEETLTQSAPYVQWASTVFYRSADQVVRRWWLWQPACDKNHQQPQVVPSAELLAATLIVNGITPNTLTELTTALAPFKPKNCTDAPEFHTPQTIKIGDLPVSTGAQNIRQRIVYGLPWKAPDPTQQPKGDIRHTIIDQQGNLILTVFSAKNFATPTPAYLEAKNQVIVIGGSYAEGRDIHATPLGEMPGMLILTNAIHSLLQYEELDPLEDWQKSLVEAVLIIIMSLAFAYWESFWAMLFSGLFITLVLLPASIALFRYGYWLDFAIPLLTVFLHELAAEFEKLQEELREKLTT